MVTKPKRDMNACEDFLNVIYITGAIMKQLNITDPDVHSSSIIEEFWVYSEEEPRQKMDNILSDFIEEYVDIKYNLGKSTRDARDKVLEYTKQVLSTGCIYLEFVDAVREGDSERVLRCWKYLLVIFHNTNRHNYAKEAISLLYQYYHNFLTPHQMEQLLYSRFVNTVGLPGRNVSADLHMEHLNREIKLSISGLQANKTEAAILRYSRALGTIAPILQQFDECNKIPDHYTRHVRPSMKKDMLEIMKHIRSCKVFNFIPGRKYASFPNPCNLLKKTEEKELLQWIKTHL